MIRELIRHQGGITFTKEGDKYIIAYYNEIYFKGDCIKDTESKYEEICLRRFGFIL